MGTCNRHTIRLNGSVFRVYNRAQIKSCLVHNSFGIDPALLTGASLAENHEVSARTELHRPQPMHAVHGLGNAQGRTACGRGVGMTPKRRCPAMNSGRNPIMRANRATAASENKGGPGLAQL